MITIISEKLYNQNELLSKMKMLADVALEDSVIDYEQHDHILTTIKSVAHDWNR